METLGTKLRYLRGAISQEKIAEIIGVSTTSYGKWESDKSMPRTKFLKKLAEHYKIDVDELLDENEKIMVSIHDNNISNIQGENIVFTNNSNNNNTNNNTFHIQQSPELIELVQKQTEQITKAIELITKVLEAQFRITEVLNKKN
jgi:transcriptional regulator with XRE-family HTH domain